MACNGVQTKRHMRNLLDDDEDWDKGPIVVRRTIHEATRKFEKSLGRGAPGAVGEAQDRAEKSRAAGKPRAAARWEEIYRYLMDQNSFAEGTKKIILKPGEKYDYENNKVIRSRAR